MTLPRKLIPALPNYNMPSAVVQIFFVTLLPLPAILSLTLGLWWCVRLFVSMVNDPSPFNHVKGIRSTNI